MDTPSQLDSRTIARNLFRIADRFCTHFSALPAPESDEVDPGVHGAFGKALSQLRACTGSVAAVLDTGDESLFVTLPALSRTAFETGVRIYWAWDDRERWRWLSVFWITQDLKQIRHLSRLPDAPDYSKLIKTLEKFRCFLAPSEELRKQKVSMEAMLQDIESDQKDRGDAKLCLAPAADIYAISYRTLSAISHAHIRSTTVRAEEHATHCIVALQTAFTATLAAFANWLARGEADLRGKREIADRLLVCASDNPEFDVDSLRLTAYSAGSERVADWSLRR